jgi:hypothetical protein
MTPRTPQCEVFFPLLSSSEHSGVPEDSQPSTFPSGVATLFFLLPSTNTKHYFPLQEACEISVQNYMKIILEAKRKPPIIRVCLLKRRRREVKKDPKLDGQWKDLKLGGQWNVLSLVAIGR